MSSLAEYQAGQREEQCKGEGRGEEKAAGAQQLWGKAPGTNQEQQQTASEGGVLCHQAVFPSQGAGTVYRLVLRQDLGGFAQCLAGRSHHALPGEHQHLQNL